MSASVMERDRPRMTHWSRHDPVMGPRQGTEHWAILRMKSAYPRYCTHEDVGQQRSAALQQIQNGSVTQRDDRRQRLIEAGDGRVDPHGDPVFAQVETRDLHGNIPGNYVSTVRPKTSPKRSCNSARSSYSERAKQGYQYWYQERPKPTSFGRYGIGSYKTVLGIGNAPRT